MLFNFSLPLTQYGPMQFCEFFNIFVMGTVAELNSYYLDTFISNRWMK